MNNRAPSGLPFVWKLSALFGVLLLLVAAYTVYWFTLAGRFESELEAAKGKAQDNGFIPEWEELSFSGFPFRLGIDFTGASLSRGRGDTHWTWTVPALTVQMLPYKLDHAIADFSGEQNIYIAGPEGAQQFAFTAEAFWASHVQTEGFAGRTAFETKAFTAEGTDRQSGDRLGGLSADHVQLNTRPAPGGAEGTPLPATYDLAIRGENIAWDFAPLVPWLERDIAQLEIQMRADHLPRHLPADADDGLKDWAAAGGKLAISHLRLLWGPVDMTGQGTLTLDAQGRPQGRFDTSFDNVEGLFNRLVEAGLVKPEAAPMIFTGVNVLAALQGKPQDGRAHLPLVFQDGVVFLGPVAVGRLEPVY
ncbi:DUF2125 domain-containing protein [Tepidicaulis sp. LMO-SS28]|uniref:DUF2125 domain-containing protein n=1 Tax=Tepidicaulis sp. LMO-SS28 TaxID=3447455 RepID=UPI003EE30FF3